MPLSRMPRHIQVIPPFIKGTVIILIQIKKSYHKGILTQTLMRFHPIISFCQVGVISIVFFETKLLIISYKDTPLKQCLQLLCRKTAVPHHFPMNLLLPAVFLRVPHFFLINMQKRFLSWLWIKAIWQDYQ